MTTAEPSQPTDDLADGPDTATIEEPGNEPAKQDTWLDPQSRLGRKLEPFLQRVDGLLSRIGDRLNPILVKEARQALKSRQFVATFFILLACAWGWSLLGVAIFSINMPGESPPGWAMLIGYFLVLLVPVLLVVPHSAFRSLAGEREDGTFELVSITSLSANQIITGKLASALLQLLLCFSVLAPCIVFTYVLRGVDLAIIGLTLGYTFMCSLLFVSVGLLIGATSKSKHWNTFFTVIILVVFVGGGILFSWFILAAVISTDGGIPTDEPEFWVGNLTFLSIYSVYIVIALMAAGAQVSFASDNRSTRLRIVMVVQQALFVGWGFYFFVSDGDPSFLYLTTSLSAVHWSIMGCLMIGEGGRISPRARRKLPQSAVGRALLTWFNPGSGTGYMLAVSNMIMVIVLVFIGGEIGLRALQLKGFRIRTMETVQWMTYFSCMYVIFYLGVTRLVMLFARRFGLGGLFLSLLIGIVVAAMGTGLPPLIQQYLEGSSTINYTSFQTFNWIWTIDEVGGRKITGEKNSEVIWILFFFTAIVVVANLVTTVKDVMLVAQATPRRVSEDDAAPS